MDKIKILYLIDVFFEFGGAERNLYDIVKHLDKDKFTPFVVALKAGENFREFEKLGVYSKSLEVKRIYDFKGIKSLISLIKFVKKENIAVIVSYHESSDILAVLAGKIAGVKTIISSRRDLGYKLKKRHIFIYRIINRYFARIIAVSRAVAEVIIKREKVFSDKVIVIYNGVDFERANITAAYTEPELIKLGIDKNKILVGVMATFRPVKGLDYFIKAAQIIAPRKDNIQFLIIGRVKNNSETDEYTRYLEKLATGKSVVFVDFQKDSSKMINLLDLVVLPSLSEGFSNALIETMAAGKPVVATSVGGNPEAVIDGVTGILVSPANEQALAEAIIRIIDNDDLKNKMGLEAQKQAKEKFGMINMMKSNEFLYMGKRI
jgi:L-malate glycosyltransferase